jgi:hypothetical protein
MFHTHIYIYHSNVGFRHRVWIAIHPDHWAPLSKHHWASGHRRRHVGGRCVSHSRLRHAMNGDIMGDIKHYTGNINVYFIIWEYNYGI